MRGFRNIGHFFRVAPWTMRLRLVGGVLLLAFALAMFFTGHIALGAIAAILYVLDLAIVGPAMTYRAARRSRG
jgi:hypothetical protein